jgi:hypothetical protein
MGYQETKLADAQKKLQDYLDAQPADTSPYRDYFSGLDTQRATDTQDILNQVGAKYGTSPLGSSGADVTAYNDPKILARREAAIGQMDLGAKEKRFRQLVNYALEEYQSKGYDLKQSEAFARQWAQDRINRENSTDEFNRNKEYAIEQNKIKAQYAPIGEQGSGNAYEQALYRSLFGAGTAAAIYGGKKLLAKKPGDLPSGTQTVDTNWQMDSSGMESA